MNILCKAGFHKPSSSSRSNAGYSFSTCARCSADLVRRGTGRWRSPRGFRVVWKSPAEAATDILLQTPAAALGKQSRYGPSELPIQEVLRLLKNHEFMDEPGQTSTWDMQIVVQKEAALKRIARDDFMAPKPNDIAAPDPLHTADRRRSILSNRG